MVGAAIDELLVLGADPPVGPAASRRRERAASRSSRLSIDRIDLVGVWCASSSRASSGAAPGAASQVSTWRYLVGSLRPVAGGRHPQADRGERGGVGAQDARAERHRPCLRHGADRGALVVGEAAFGADQDRGGAGRGGRGQRLAAAARRRRTGCGRPASRASSASSFDRFGELGQRGALALLGRLDRCARAAARVEPVDDRAPGESPAPAAPRRARSPSRPASRSGRA